MEATFYQLPSGRIARATGDPITPAKTNNGLDWVKGIGDALDSLGDAFANIGGVFKKPSTDTTAVPDIPPAPKTSTTTWILIGVGVLALIVGLIWFVKKKKK